MHHLLLIERLPELLREVRNIFHNREAHAPGLD
jgi:hypothetical protein